MREQIWAELRAMASWCDSNGEPDDENYAKYEEFVGRAGLDALAEQVALVSDMCSATAGWPDVQVVLDRCAVAQDERLFGWCVAERMWWCANYLFVKVEDLEDIRKLCASLAKTAELAQSLSEVLPRVSFTSIDDNVLTQNVEELERSIELFQCLNLPSQMTGPQVRARFCSDLNALLLHHRPNFTAAKRFDVVSLALRKAAGADFGRRRFEQVVQEIEPTPLNALAVRARTLARMTTKS